MFLRPRSLSHVMHAVMLTAVSASSLLTGHPAIAQPAASQSAVVRAASSQPVFLPQEVLDHLGIQRPKTANMTQLSQQVAQQVRSNGLPPGTSAPNQPASGGLPTNLSGQAALSAVIMTTLNSSSNSNYRDVMLMADADGTEDLTADHSAKIDDRTTSELPNGWMLTRSAISEHSFATGYSNTAYYYGDSVGNVYVGIDTIGNGIVTTYTVLNLPTLLNAFGTLNSDNQIVITGLGVNPVADLSSFPKVNGSFEFFNGKIGEILYVSFWDTGGGLRLVSNGQLIRSGVLAFPIADDVSPVRAAPGIQSDEGFPLTVGGSFGVAFSAFSNVAGLAVDDDGNVYFQQVDLINFTGGNITKITSVDQPGTGGNQDRSPAVYNYGIFSTLTPFNGDYGSITGPSNQSNRFTNYSGTSRTFGNIAALAAGPNNIVYAALARSLVTTDTSDVQKTEGLFVNPTELGPTPAMIISFADTSGASDTCSIPQSNVTGPLPIADGFADVTQANLTLAAGVNNFHAFAFGNGPDVRGTLVGATVSNTLQLDMQIDYTIYSGLAVDEESKVYVISGGTPVGIGLDPSPLRGEILIFPDKQPFDRRSDYIDLRGDLSPNPPLSGGNVGDGDSDRYDHIFYQAPLEQVSLTPAGISGLARGFLVYLNRTRANTALFPNLPNGYTQANDETSGPLFFESFDASHQIAGGDDQNYPSRGDDNDGAGTPTMPGPLLGGYEFNYRQYVTQTNTLAAATWNAFYWNSNGSITFGGGDSTGDPHVANFLGGLPRVAGAWADLNSGSKVPFTNTFPVQALGFASVNHFVVRWINVPASGLESCDSSNSFTISLYDDGTGLDENANQPLNPANSTGNNAVPFDLQEGPTDLRYVASGISNTLTSFRPRPDKSGNICLTYGRMDLLGSPISGTSVLVGVAPGNLPITTSPGINLSEAARANDRLFPSPLGLPLGPGLVNTLFTPSTVFEFFGQDALPVLTRLNGAISSPITPTFDLRQEGNDTVLSTPIHQPDLNRGQVCFYIVNYSVLMPVIMK
jgi:hypothetical protein